MAGADAAGGDCRFCFEEAAAEPGLDAADDCRLVSPCACRGTQALVHLCCLRRWQRELVYGSGTAAALVRASSCPVCREPLVVDGAPLGPVAAEPPGSGLVGTLLVSSSKAKRTVVLVCEVGERKAVRGVDVTCLLQEGSTPSGLPALSAAAEDPIFRAAQAAAGSLKVRLYSGGPVCQGRLSVVRYWPLSTFPVVVPGRAARTRMVLAPRDGAPGLYTPAPWAGLEANQAADFVRHAASLVPKSGRPQWLLLFRGHTAWSPEPLLHQRPFERTVLPLATATRIDWKPQSGLDAEVEIGSWLLCEAEVADILDTPPEGLWGSLQTTRQMRKSLDHPGVGVATQAFRKLCQRLSCDFQRARERWHASGPRWRSQAWAAEATP